MQQTIKEFTCLNIRLIMETQEQKTHKLLPNNSKTMQRCPWKLKWSKLRTTWCSSRGSCFVLSWNSQVDRVRQPAVSCICYLSHLLIPCVIVSVVTRTWDLFWSWEYPQKPQSVQESQNGLKGIEPVASGNGLALKWFECLAVKQNFYCKEPQSTLPSTIPLSKDPGSNLRILRKEDESIQESKSYHMKNANLNFGLCVIRKLILNDFDSYIHVCLSCIAPCHLPKGSLTNQLFNNISAWQTQITISILSLYNCPFLPHHVPAQKAIIDSSDPPEEWENTAWSVVDRQK